MMNQSNYIEIYEFDTIQKQLQTNHFGSQHVVCANLIHILRKKITCKLKFILYSDSIFISDECTEIASTHINVHLLA